VLSNVYVLTEGWDAPRAKVCLLARGCGAEGTYLQMVGRVLRRHGDDRALVVDLAGVVREHGMPDEDRDFTLDGIHRKGKDDREWLCQCRTCGAVVRGVARGPACRCGAPWPPPSATAIEERPVVAVAAVATRRERATVLDALTETARARGYKPGWVGVRFKEQFGFWPKGLGQ
jgi:superfamily II DNA or RNA helicase